MGSAQRIVVLIVGTVIGVGIAVASDVSLARRARRATLDAAAWRQEAPRNEQSYREVPLVVTLEGPGAALLELAERMERPYTKTALARADLTPAQRPGRARAELEILLLEAPSAAAPAARR